ncbi:MAG: 4-hydroxythreonine-4-phosphate dehydrogenase PdxA [Planctomycetes bacterium]|nr:4-hydroxythreonine-4-phosphate dehydrogenase PdxA [Planctomycetota bacterium]
MTDEDSGEFEVIEFPAPLLITSGDPGGVGPEVTHKAIKKLQRKKEILPERPICVVGDAFLYARHLEKPSAMQTYNIVPIEDFLADAGYLLAHLHTDLSKPWRPVFLDCGEKGESKHPIGKQNSANGERAVVYLDAAVELLAEDLVDAVCTAPICKETAAKHGWDYPGQTEFFAEACEVDEPVMMLTGGGLRVSLVTTHIPLARVPRRVTRKRIRSIVRTTAEALKADFGIDNPRIAVCGLNPHAGEGGRFGDDEKKNINPALKALKRDGINVTGPLPADTVFHRALQGEFDCVVAMYHDQGLAPLKTIAFDEGVNITCGLPIVRTAPDHGTAFDIAGQNIASHTAMYNAILQADEIAKAREAGH